MEAPVLNALLAQDEAKLPFGLLEKWAYSTDRDKLLEEGETRGVPEEKGDETDEEEDEDVLPTQAASGSLIPGSEEHIFYTLRHLSTKMEGIIEKMEDMSKLGDDETYQAINKRVDKIIDDLEESKGSFSFSLLFCLKKI